MSNRTSVFTKDPDSILDYSVSWVDWLPGADVIDSSQWIVSTDLTVENSSFTDTETVVWLSGGVVGQRETVTNRITTAAGRTEDFSFTISVREK